MVAVRRSGFGERLLAMKDSPAACATLGLDVTRLKLAVFALSAAMAGVGGALYAGTLGSVAPERFAIFESLPLLLLAVVGGIGSAAGALFAGLILAGFPIAIGIWPILANLNRVLPGHDGRGPGTKPERRRPRHRHPLRHPPRGARRAVGPGRLDRRPLGAGGDRPDQRVGAHARRRSLALVAWPLVAEWLVARRTPRRRGARPGVGRARPGRCVADELRAVDDALQLEEVVA